MRKASSLFIVCMCLAFPLSWGDVNWDGNVINAQGQGVVAEKYKGTAQAKLLAREAAYADGLRNLSITIEGIRIEASTTIKDLAVDNDTIEGKLFQLIKGAEVSAEQFDDSTGIYTVVFKLPINGDGSLGKIIGRKLKLITASKESNKPVISKQIPPNMITALGIGLAPDNEENNGKAMLMAKKAAEVDAYRNLVEIIYGIRVDAKTTVKNLMVENDEVNSRTQGLIKNPVTISEKQNNDGSYEVIVGLPLTGKNSLSEYLGVSIDDEFDTTGLHKDSSLVEKKKEGQIDWGNNIIIGIGSAVAPSTAKDGKARVLARRAAIVDAQRKLIQVIRGVRVDSKTTVKDLELASDVVKTNLDGFVKGYRILDEKYDRDGVYTVKIGVKLFGEAGLQGIVSETLPAAKEAPMSVVQTNENYFSGLILDTKGIKCSKVMYPQIVSVTGDDIYSVNVIHSTLVEKMGFVAYSNSLIDALSKARTGSKPMVIRPLSYSENNGKQAFIVSKEDALKIKTENEKTNFLEQLKVTIVTD